MYLYLKFTIPKCIYYQNWGPFPSYIHVGSINIFCKSYYEKSEDITRLIRSLNSKDRQCNVKINEQKDKQWKKKKPPHYTEIKD